MQSFLQLAGGSAAILALASFGVAPAQDVADPKLPDGIEVRTHGPVHEAFAQPSDLQPVPGQVVPKEPPPPVPEEPPEERPEGDNVQFIPGYWAWDPDENQFLWVSGSYRNVPVGRQWVAGHWVRSDEGWRWVPGLWAPEQQQELRYTPEPPAPLQVEPSVPAPDDNSTWVAGTWVYRDTRFVWRPGYWSPFRVGRVWVGARYVWTPGGYLFNDGYWDYPWDDRGLLFAPVYFSRPYWHTRGWFWRPSYVVNFGLFYDSCFTRRGSFSFYFGNYYGPRYAGYGYNPWFHGHGRYDSAFGYHRWRNGHGNNWYAQQRQLYADRGAGRSPVPPRNLAQQQQLLNSKAALNNNFARAVAPLNQAKALNKNVNLARLTPTQTATQKALMQRSQEITKTRNLAVGPKVGGVNTKMPQAANAASIKLPPLVSGTESTRSSAATIGKQRDGNSGGRISKGKTLPETSGQGGRAPANSGTKSGNKPGATASTAPKTTFPNPGRSEFNPNAGAIRSTPNFNKSPISPSYSGGKGPTPKTSDFKNTVPPKSYSPSVSPKASDRSLPSQRSYDLPRNTPSAPRYSAPSAPKYSAPSTPRSFSPPSNYRPPSTSRYSGGSSQRFSAPSAPRYSAPSSSRSVAPRSSPAPRSGGGGKGRR